MIHIFLYLNKGGRTIYSNHNPMNGLVCAECYTDLGFDTIKRYKFPKIHAMLDKRYRVIVDKLNLSWKQLTGSGELYALHVYGYRPISPLKITDFASTTDKKGYWHWFKNAPQTYAYSLGYGKGEGELGDFTVEEPSVVMSVNWKQIMQLQVGGCDIVTGYIPKERKHKNEPSRS